MKATPILGVSIFLLAALGFWTAPAATRVWTNASGGSWSVAENWDPQQIPGEGDTALLTNAGNYVVSLDSGYAVVERVVIGPGVRLNVAQSWVQAAQMEVSGTLGWDGGTLSGNVTVTPNGILQLNGDSEKMLDRGSTITNYGLIQWSGQGMLTGNDWDSFAGHPTIANLPGALFEIQSDTILRVAPWVWNFDATVVFQNAGTVRKTGGLGSSTFNNISFENSGVVEVQQGTLVFTGGNGAHFVSSGLFQVAAGTAVQLTGGNCNFLPGHMAQGSGYFGLGIGGMLTLSGQVAGRFDWAEGVFSGKLTVATNGVLSVSGDTEKLLDAGAAITNCGLIQWTGQGVLTGNDWDTYSGHPAILNMPGAVFEIQNDTTLRVAPWVWNFDATVIFQNAGTVRKVAGSGITTFNNVSFANSGIVEVQHGTLIFSGGNGAHLVSSGRFQVAAGTAVQLTGGSCNFLPGHEAQGQGYFGLAVGGMLSLSGQVAGRFDWAEGVFSGKLTVATNGVFRIAGDTEKLLDAGAAITNYGLVQWSGQGVLTGNDWDTYSGHPTIVNKPGAVFEIQNDTTLRVAPWVWNFDATVMFQNAGTVRKVAGPGITTFNNVSFANSGIVDVQQGTLIFTGGNGAHLVSSGLFQVAAGAAVQLDGGSCNFLPGHQAQGQGYFGLGVGGMLSLNGQVAGRFDWAEGVFSGKLTIATNGILTISGDTEKLLDAGAAITNFGRIEWSGQGVLTGNDWDTYSGHPAIVNMPGAVFEIQNDSTLRVAPWVWNFDATVIFKNAGTVRKVAGAAMTTFNNVSFENTGTVAVEQGALAFSGGNGAHLVSSGPFQVSAGAAVRLTGGSCNFLSGHEAQGQGYFGLGVGGMLTLSGQVAGRFDWAEGVFSGKLTVPTNGTLYISGDTEKLLDAGSAITNYGLVQWTGQGTVSGNDWDTYAGHPAIVNKLGAVFEIQNDATLRLAPWIWNFDATVLFQNAGTVRKVAGPGMASFDGVQLVNTGSLEITSGSLEMGYSSHWTELGTVKLAIQSTSSYSRIQANGVVNVAAVLTPEFVGGYLPSAGDAFELLTYNSANVGFSAVNLPPLPAGLYFSTLVSTQQVIVETRQDPIANPDAFALFEDTPDDLDVLANDSHLYGPGAIASYTQPAHGTLTLNPDQTLHYVPASEFHGDDGFSYLASNADGRMASAMVTLTIAAVNDAPIIAPLADRTVNESTLLTFQATASDVENDSLTFTLGPGAPSGAAIHPSTGVFSWTPTESQGPGVYSVTVIVSDNGVPSQSASRTFSVTVLEVNVAPVLGSQSDRTIAELQPLNVQLSATDADLPANTLTFSLISGPSGMSVSPGGLLTWTPIEVQGPGVNTVTVAVVDNGQPSLGATQSFQVTVTETNSAPALTAQTNRTINELTLLTVTNTASDSDVPANTLSYALLIAPSGAAITTNGVITWTPSEAQGPSSNLFVTMVTDNGSPALSATNSFSVIVNEVNSAPMLDLPSDRTIAELQSVSVQLTATDSDVPANTLSFSLVSGPAGLSVSPSGQLDWTPTEAQGPSANTVTVSVADNGQPSLSATQSFQITVTEANSAPVLPAQTNRTINELTLLSVTNTASDSDLPANTLSYTLLNSPSGATISSSGVITWTPSEAQGPSSNLFVTVVTDNGSPALSATNAFSVMVDEVNSAPVLATQSAQTIPELQVFTLQLAATDSDLPANTLSFSLVSGPAGLSVSPSGLLTWTPTEAQGPSVNTVTVSVADDGQPSLSATQSFQVTVTEGNSAPVLGAQSDLTINELTLLTVTNTATDPDLPANTLSYALLTAPAGATINSNGVISWIPSEAQGPSSNLFVTVVTDNGSPTMSATNAFSVVVNEVNSAPIFAVQSDQTINELQTFTLQLAATDSDLPANALTYSLISGPAGLSVSSSGQFTWTPTEAQGPSINSVTVAVADNGQPSLSATQSFQITVAEANSAPLLGVQADVTIDELTLLTVTNTATDSDVPANTLSYALLNAPNGAAISSSGVITWTPAEPQGPSTNLFVTVVTDNGSPALSATNSFNVIVNEVNTAPVLTAQSDRTIAELQAFNLQLAGTDADLPPNTLTFNLVSGPAGLSVNASGLLTWTPTEAQGPSVNTVTVSVADDGQPSLSATQSFQITVAEANSAPLLGVQAEVTIDELTLLTVTNTATDSDVPANTLSYALLNAPSGAAINSSGVITWTPSESQGPSTNLFVTVVTDNGSPALNATNSFNVIVNEVNTAPVLTAQSDRTIAELQAFSLQLIATDADLPANTLTFNLVSGPAALSVNASGLVTWTPTEAQGPSVNTVTVSVSDNGQPSLTATQSFQITVTEANSAPVLASQTNRTINELTLLTVTNSATDSDLPANTLTYALLNAPSGAAISTSGVITWTPSEAQGPSSNLFVTIVTDNGSPALSATNTFSVLVNEVNTAPVLASQADQTITELQSLSLQLTATDSDLPANTLSFSLVSGPGGLSVSASGLLTWTPTEAQGPSVNTVTVSVADNGQPSLSATQSFQITVAEANSAPVLAAQSDRTINELTLLTVTNAASDSDLPANTLTYTLLSSPSGATISSSGVITWTPSEAQGPSSNLFVTVVTDNGAPALSATNSFAVTVNEVNQAPSLTAVPNQTLNELATLNLQLAATDADLPANTLTFGLVSGPAGLTVGASGALSWIPSEAQGPSTNQVMVRVFDNGSPSLSATQSFSITVNELNTAPNLTPISDQTISGLQALSLTFSATDSDLPANTLTFSLDVAPTGATVTSGGIFSWTPVFAQAGTTNTVTVRVTDNGTPSLNATRTFSIVVVDTGLIADYFSGTNFNTLVTSRNDAQVDFNWTSSPATGVPADQFSVRWTGQIIPRYSQTYTFSTVTDDGVRLWVNGFPIIDNWTVHLTTTNTGTIALTAGQKYQIKLEYFDNINSALCRLLWASSSQASEVVPASQLRCTGYTNVINNAIYRFTPKIATGKCMEVTSGGTSDGTQASINNWGSKTWQKWQPVDVGGGHFKLVPQHITTKVLEINGGFTTNGTRVQISTDAGSVRQHFRFVDSGQGWFKLQPQSAPASLLQVKGGNTANGTPVEQSQDNATDPQFWRLDRQ